MNILIVKMSAIGDVVHTLPALNALRVRFPDAHIAWLVEEAASSLVEGHQALDRVLISKRKRWVKGLLTSQCPDNVKEMTSFIKQLTDTDYDLILDFQSLLKSSILITLAKGKRKIGFDRGMEHAELSHLFLNERVPPVDMEIHALTRGMMLLHASLGIQNKEITFNLPVQDVHRDSAKKLLVEHGVKRGRPFVMIHPVARWETKLWSSRRFSTLTDRLIEQYDAKVVFTGSRQDRHMIHEIISNMKGDAANLAGETTLKMLAALYEKSDFVISTDTGPMHLAAAVGTPVVALFGPTAPWRTGPFGSDHQIIRAGLECSPCFKRSCQTVECMAQISVENVLEGAQKIVEVA
jgi:3-deoxy-D-manno-octulosonic-acid transferase/heptosyltransferase-1